MKKIFAVIMIVALMLTLTGCFGTSTSTATEETVVPKELSEYSKDFTGLQQYLIDHSILPYAKLTSTATDDSASTSSVRTEVYYDLLGADDGVRYLISGNVFVELYDFGSADNATAKAVLADIADDGKFSVIEGYEELTGVISKSGKYVAVYNAKNNYDYAKITDELENW